MGAAFKIVMVVVVVSLCGALPATSPSQEELLKVQNYLSQFYPDTVVSTSRAMQRSSQVSFESNLRKMQTFFGLEVTGQADSRTLEVMSRPRCGFIDINRYGLFEGRPKWNKTVVTYRITDYTPDLGRSDVDATIAKALKLYSDVAPIDFKQIDSDAADIIIKFKAGDHGDFAPFDGKYGVLAHAFSPGEGIGGDTHFDDDEDWTLTSAGTNLFLVAAHEFGHALGLAHSEDETALMHPTYKYVNTEGYMLPDDDRKGIQALYGVRAKSPGQSEPELPPNKCDTKLSFDAATSIKGDLYFFKDGYFWKRSHRNNIIMKKIQSVWPGVNKVDAAYENNRQHIVIFFEGNHYWVVTGNTVLPGYPKPLSDFGLPASVTKVDAAVYLPLTSRTLFFVRNRYWSYNERRGRMDVGYPKLIRRGLPRIAFQVDAAFEKRGYLYFSHGFRQKEYDFRRRRVRRTLLNYEWMDC
ncbi:matrix metallopeptidase 30 [Mugil cephalus]|uniref:matrix metallopeptidase 30 n=1 Tax=Mugil cephalus TaxID=48193 RepID=UPI001FB768F7|nr:matrix metallopeptidase 30 [Mugil cephalus]